LLSCDGRRFVLFFVLVFAGRGGLLHAEHGALQYLVVQFGFSEQNRPAVQLLLAIFRDLAMGLIGLFLLLRFEPNFLFALFGS
jgi:hypothetical protein